VKTDYTKTLVARTEAEERPRLAAAAREALAQEPSEAALVALSAAVGALGKLSPADQKRAAAHVRFGLRQSGELLWEGVHLACEIEIPDEQIDDLVDHLEDMVADPKIPGSTRARALEGFAELSGIPASDKYFQEITKEDDSWTVRRVSRDSSRRIAKRESVRGMLFGRFAALIRTERLRTEATEEIVEPDDLRKYGLRLPSTLKRFFLEHFMGGKITRLELVAKGDPAEIAHLTIRPPRGYPIPAYLDRPKQRKPDIKNFDEYIYTRYIDGESRYPKVDEAYALGRYAEEYAAGVLDQEAYTYGVLSFERAYVDEEQRAVHLLRCRDLLRVYRDKTGEEWEEIDDRHDEAQDTITSEGLEWPLRDQPQLPLQIGVDSGVFEIAIDLEGQGVWSRDPDVEGWRLVAPCLSAYLNRLVLPPVDTGPELTPLDLVGICREQISAGQRRKAGRTLADCLEQDRKSAPLLEALGALLGELEPLEAGQLLAAIMLEGDKTSSDSAKAALNATDPAQALAMIEALVPYDEDGSQVALLVDCAAALRRKSHAEVRAVAKDSRDKRGKRQIRTLRNPFYG